MADSLISNLGGKVDEGVQAAWEAEIGKRVAELDSGRRRLLHGRKCADAISRSFPMLTDWAEFHDEAAAEYDAALTGTVSAAQMPHLNLTLKWTALSRTSLKLLGVGRLARTLLSVLAPTISFYSDLEGESAAGGEELHPVHDSIALAFPGGVRRCGSRRDFLRDSESSRGRRVPRLEKHETWGTPSGVRCPHVGCGGGWFWRARAPAPHGATRRHF